MSAAMKKPEDLFPSEPPSAQQQKAADDLALLVQPALDRKPRAFRSSKSQIERARAQMLAMSESGVWDDASGAHLVALYEHFHFKVYGVANAELDGKNWALASQAAGRMASTHFENDYGKAVIFIRWVWKKEAWIEERRRERQESGRSIGWRLQFAHGSLITQYKIDCARTGR